MSFPMFFFSEKLCNRVFQQAGTFFGIDKNRIIDFQFLYLTIRNVILLCVVVSLFEAPVTHRCASVSPVSFPYVPTAFRGESKIPTSMCRNASALFSHSDCSADLLLSTVTQLPNSTQTVLY
jgi:hypothetical protein